MEITRWQGCRMILRSMERTKWDRGTFFIPGDIPGSSVTRGIRGSDLRSPDKAPSVALHSIEGKIPGNTGNTIQYLKLQQIGDVACPPSERSG